MAIARQTLTAVNAYKEALEAIFLFDTDKLYLVTFSASSFGRNSCSENSALSLDITILNEETVALDRSYALKVNFSRKTSRTKTVLAAAREVLSLCFL